MYFKRKNPETLINYIIVVLCDKYICDDEQIHQKHKGDGQQIHQKLYAILLYWKKEPSPLPFFFFDVKEDNHMKRMERVKEGIMPLIIPEKFNCDALEDDITEFLASTKRNNSYIAATDTDEFNMIFS